MHDWIRPRPTNSITDHVHTSRSPPTPAPPPPTLTPPGGSPATGGHPILSRYQIPSLPLVWSPRTAPPRWPWWVGHPLTSLDPTIPWTPPSPPNLGSHRVLQLGVSSWILYVWPFSGFQISSVSQMWFLSNTHYVVLLRLENCRARVSIWMLGSVTTLLNPVDDLICGTLPA
jgi:hypothetical protein